MSGKRKAKAAQLAASLAMSANARLGVAKGAGGGVTIEDMMPAARALTAIQKQLARMGDQRAEIARLMRALAPDPVPAADPRFFGPAPQDRGMTEDILTRIDRELAARSTPR